MGVKQDKCQFIMDLNLVTNLTQKNIVIHDSVRPFFSNNLLK